MFIRVLVINLIVRLEIYKFVISKDGGVWSRWWVLWLIVYNSVLFVVVVIMDRVKFIIVRMRKNIGLIIVNGLFVVCIEYFGEEIVCFIVKVSLVSYMYCCVIIDVFDFRM